MELKLNRDERKYLIQALGSYEGKESVRLIRKIEKSMKSLKPSSAKGKGRNFQYWVCERLADLLGIEFVQSDDECPIHSREMGQHNVDIVLRGVASKAFPYDIECKAQETLSIPDWISQAKTNTKEGRDWMLIVKKQSVGEPFVILDFDRFLELYRTTERYSEHIAKNT